MISMKKNLTFLKKIAVGLLLLMCMSVNANASTHYVKPFGSMAWANVPFESVYEFLPDGVFALDATHLSSDTYYFAPGTYNINATLAIATGGVIYGGVSLTAVAENAEAGK